ncbi:MAG: hypothetical protein JXM70_27505 [Pirellulales bacterium]|nr:hypothetical protein [Pirellulales bacterium]
MAGKTDRRCFLARGILGATAAGAAYTSIEEDILQAAIENGSAKPSAANTNKPKTSIPPGSLPCGKIGNVSLSRLLIGGNLIGGSAHSRDLMYASKLFTSYNTEAKVFETLEIALACGINAIQINPKCFPLVKKFNKGRTAEMKTMVCIPFFADKDKMKEEIKRHVDLGVTMLYSHGGVTDRHMMRGGQIGLVGQMVDFVKAQGLPAGVGSHSLNVPMACEKEKIDPDFYVKTFHTDKYWSATPKEHRKEFDFMHYGTTDHNLNHDNMWCNNPEETAAFMKKVEKPWVAFKVMAAGAIRPQIAFRHAFNGGADFIIAGMFDFQVESDVKVAIDSVKKAHSRKRPWRA